MFERLNRSFLLLVQRSTFSKYPVIYLHLLLERNTTRMSDLSGSGNVSALRTAVAPFDSGDVVLRSSDNVDFHTYKVILSFASPILKTCSA